MPDIPPGAKFRSFSKRRHQGVSAAGEGGSRRRRGADELALSAGGTSDMDRWLEQVFDQALDGTLVDTDDERTLSGRIKGGGDNPRQPSTVGLLPVCSLLNTFTLLKQEAFEKCWAHSPLRAAARRLF